GDAAARAEYLAHFRADSIVRDCAPIRRELLGEDGRWSLLGQSYGVGLGASGARPAHLDHQRVRARRPPVSSGRVLDRLIRLVRDEI
ncbi:hypothetical protein ACFQZ8_20070, partial [Micromonospora azadirachtae]